MFQRNLIKKDEMCFYLGIFVSIYKFIWLKRCKYERNINHFGAAYMSIENVLRNFGKSRKH